MAARASGSIFAQGRPDNPVNAGSVVNPVTPDLFPIIDRSMFGVNFDPSQYRAELVFKPLAMNTATNLNVTLDTFDGFDASGARRASQWQWHFFNLASPDPSTDPLMSGPDAGGFYTVINGDGPDADTQGGSLVAGNSFYGGSAAPSFMFTQQPLPGTGDADPDFNDFEAFEPGGLAVPNGVYQISLQTAFGDPAALVDHFAIKSLRIVKINPDPEEVARLDGRSGLSQRLRLPVPPR